MFSVGIEMEHWFKIGWFLTRCLYELINPFQVSAPFLHPLTTEDQRISNVFKGVQKGNIGLK